MTMFLCGLALLFVAFGDRFWAVIGWGPTSDEAPGVTTIRMWSKLIAGVLSFIFLAYGFPAIPDGVSHAGCVATAIVLLVTGLTEFLWKQEMFKTLMDDDEDYKFGYGLVRIFAVVVGLVFLVVGIGTGHEDWMWNWEIQEMLNSIPGPPEVVSTDT